MLASCYLLFNRQTVVPDYDTPGGRGNLCGCIAAKLKKQVNIKYYGSDAEKNLCGASTRTGPLITL